MGWDVRGGKWQTEFSRRCVSAAEAVSHVTSGDRVWIAPQQNPEALLSALVARAGDVRDVEIEAIILADYGWGTPELAESFRVKVLQAVDATRPLIEAKFVDYVPWWVFLANKATDEGRRGSRPVDVTMFSVSPPNEHGYCCFGNVLWDAKDAARRARLVLAQVNDRLPRTFGDGWIHVSEIDWFVCEDHTPTFFDYPAPSARDEVICQHVAELLRDGDCFQIGTGRTTAALTQTGVLRGFRELGWFTEMTLPGTLDLVRDGIVTCEHVNPNPGVFVATAYNHPTDMELIDGNPAFALKPVSYVHDPRIISSIDNMVAVNSAVSIDLTGQIAAGALGSRVWSGTGGQLAFAFGALMSTGGRFISMMPSTAAGGTVSRIVPQFPQGQLITVPRELADIVVTEHGVANLLNKSQRERARELIAVADPEHRPALRRAAGDLLGA